MAYNLKIPYDQQRDEEMRQYPVAARGPQPASTQHQPALPLHHSLRHAVPIAVTPERVSNLALDAHCAAMARLQRQEERHKQGVTTM